MYGLNYCWNCNRYFIDNDYTCNGCGGALGPTPEALAPFDPSWITMWDLLGRRSLEGCLFEADPAPAPVVMGDTTRLPDRVDLREHCSPIEDQGQTNSCTAQAIVGALEYHQKKAGRPLTDLSRLFVYYNARRMADTQGYDVGSLIHHVMAAVLAYGACEERLWPWEPTRVAVPPSMQAYQNALRHEAIQYARTPLGQSALSAVAAGLPVVFGTFAPMSFYQEAATTGVMPSSRERAEPRGAGHAMLLVGYDLPAKQWIVRNSYGERFGDRGYLRIPFETLEAYSVPDQFWTIGAIEAADGIGVEGPAFSDFHRQVQDRAAAEAKAALDRLRAGLRKELKDNIDKARQGFRDRLRGPQGGR